MLIVVNNLVSCSMINEHPAMQLQNIFYYVRFVNRILDDILCMRIDSIRLVVVTAVWLAGRQFSMFHRVIIISFLHSYICNFICYG